MDKNTKPQVDTRDMDINSDSDIPGNTHLSNSGEETDEMQRLAKELEEQKDKYLRLVAEFENYKRRTSKEKVELIQTAGKEVITSLLEVMDDFDRAEKQLENTTDPVLLKEGYNLIVGKFRNILSHKGLKSMESIQTPFDYEKHEAITEVEAGPENKGKVIDEVVRGYYLNDRIIRFAKVVVGK